MGPATPGELILGSIDDRRNKARVYYFKNVETEQCKNFVNSQAWEAGGT